MTGPRAKLSSVRQILALGNRAEKQRIREKQRLTQCGEWSSELALGLRGSWLSTAMDTETTGGGKMQTEWWERISQGWAPSRGSFMSRRPRHQMAKGSRCGWHKESRSTSFWSWLSSKWLHLAVAPALSGLTGFLACASASYSLDPLKWPEEGVGSPATRSAFVLPARCVTRIGPHELEEVVVSLWNWLWSNAVGSLPSHLVLSGGRTQHLSTPSKDTSRPQLLVK